MQFIKRKNNLFYLVVPIYIFYIFILSCKKDNPPLFAALSPNTTHITFANQLAKHKLFNILYYLYYYNGGGVAVGDINNDGLQDIYFTANNKGGNKLYLNKGNFNFEDITVKAGVAGLSDWCTGVTMVDINADGYIDIYVSTVSQKYELKGHNELYINNKDLSFTERSEEYGLNLSCFSTQSAFFDYDRDGDLDCYILNQSHHPHSNITDTSNRRILDTLSGDRFYRNDGIPKVLSDGSRQGGFIDVSAEVGIYQSNLGYGLGIGIADLNNDGWEDIYIGNDFHENDYYYINDGATVRQEKDGKPIIRFIESGAKHFDHYSRFSMGNDISDFNNDGMPDIITVDMLPPDEKTLKTYGSDENPNAYKVKIDIQGYQKQYSKNCLQLNNGNGNSFSDISLLSGVSATDWSWSPLLADFDNDGNKDLFISSGIVKRPVDLDYIRFVSDMEIKKNIHQTDKYDDETIAAMPDGASHPYFFKGSGDFLFKESSTEWGTENLKGYYNGASYADLDNDGRLDMIINCINSNAILLKNNSQFKNYISLGFKGNEGNSFGIGTKAYVFSNGKIQYLEVMPTRGFESSSDYRLHFGLDTIKIIDSILIVWPDRKYQKINNLVVNQHLILDYKNAEGQIIYPIEFNKPLPVITDISSKINCNWIHRENDFLDYNRQYLIPHALSTRGPKMTTADLNKDGLTDFYICGASGHPGKIYLQKKEGGFLPLDLINTDKMEFTEEVDALFFDANNDGYMDLYIVSGGNEFEQGNPALKDNFYLNDRRGNLRQKINSIPLLAFNKSCISVVDIDRDGDLDLFVGGLCSAKTYGLPQDSYLMINNGEGVFQLADSSIINLRNMGMVTCSAFADINNDGWKDLILTGEWMPVKIFINNKGHFNSEEIPHSTGLWQTLMPTDINQDGHIDILAGNWGKNSKLSAGKSGPLKLYLKDFDRNGSVEQVMCYTISGKEYPFLAKDELERSLPVLKKAYVTYSEVAGKTVDYIFYDLFKDYQELKAESLASSYFINDGLGHFIQYSFPDELQLAPITTFNENGFDKKKSSYVAAGNFYDVIPYEGRYDALKPTFFKYDTNRGAFSKQYSISNFQGEARDIKWINQSDGVILLAIARNNESIKFYSSIDKK